MCGTIGAIVEDEEPKVAMQRDLGRKTFVFK